MQKIITTNGNRNIIEAAGKKPSRMFRRKTSEKDGREDGKEGL